MKIFKEWEQKYKVLVKEAKIVTDIYWATIQRYIAEEVKTNTLLFFWQAIVDPPYIKIFVKDSFGHIWPNLCDVCPTLAHATPLLLNKKQKFETKKLLKLDPLCEEITLVSTGAFKS